MGFVWSIALKNIKRKPLRSVMMGVLTLFLSLTVFIGSFAIISLQRGLDGYKARLGADIAVVPSSAKGHGSLDDIFLQGITGNYYMSSKEIEKVCGIEGIESVSRQFFLTSAKASCCSARVQIIGFDPETDISVKPWISSEYSGEISHGDIIIGADVSKPADGTIKFYGREYTVRAQLNKTGTGLDNAVYADMETVRQMADSAANILGTAPFEGVDINTAASALMIKVRDGYDAGAVADDINIHITKVQAQTAKSMISGISEGLGNVSGIVGILAGVIWILSVVILLTVFFLLSNERKKEFAVLRIMGASKRILFGIIGAESALISTIGAFTGILLSLLPIFSFSDTMRERLGLPFLTPDMGVTVLLAAGTLLLSAAVGVITAFITSKKITSEETGMLLREDT